MRNGVFAFKKLEPGAYTLTVLDPQWGVTSRTVQVTRNFADSAGRVDIQVVLERSEDARRRNLERENSVSLGDLTVSPKARAAFKAAAATVDQGDREGSIAQLLQAVELSPGFVEAWNELGTLAYKADDYEQAEEYFRAALRHDPEAFAPMVQPGRRAPVAAAHRRRAAVQPDGAVDAPGRRPGQRATRHEFLLQAAIRQGAEPFDAGKRSRPGALFSPAVLPGRDLRQSGEASSRKTRARRVDAAARRRSRGRTGPAGAGAGEGPSSADARGSTPPRDRR